MTIQAQSIDHVNMMVKNLKESVAFYSELFGFEEKQDQPEFHSKIIGNETIKLCLYQVKDMETGNGISHFGFYVTNFDEVEAKCREMHVEMPYGVTDWGQSRSIYIIDPNGYEVELSEVQGGGL